MGDVSIRDLRNRGGDVVDRVERGEHVTITRAGKPVAELRSLPRKPLKTGELIARLITTVTLAQLSVGPLAGRDLEERALRQTRLQLAEADFEALPFDRSAARAFGQVAAAWRRRGPTTR